MTTSSLNILVLRGGPDKERPVSLESGRQVAAALTEAGHHVTEADILPDNLDALDAFRRDDGDVIFPVLHGPWSEGGPLQRILDDAGIRYVGSRTEAASLCIDKDRTKQTLAANGLPTPESEIVARGTSPAIAPPTVVKAVNEGSSFDLFICHDDDAMRNALEELHARHDQLMVERFIDGMELTVGILGDEVLPTIHIVPATTFYDYEAKYTRDDTQYLFDIDLPAELLTTIRDQAAEAHRVLGCRHLSRVDFMVDRDNRPWILEVNTLPGLTTHSLLPKASAHKGLSMAMLCDRLVRMAMVD